MKHSFKIVALAIIALFAGVAAYAQVTTSAIAGRITDTKGGAVPGAVVIAVHVPSGTTYHAVTGGEGRYAIQGMRPGGPYVVTVSLMGYEDAQVSDIALKLGETANVAPVMKEATLALEESVVVAEGAFEASKTGAAQSITRRTIEEMPSISIDYAVAELSKKVRMVPLSCYWNDIGSWDAMYDILPKDKAGNAVKGDCITIDCKDSLLIGHDRLIAGIGIDDLLLVESDDVIVATKKGNSQKVKDVVETLKKNHRKEATEHTTLYYYWGTSSALGKGKNYVMRKLRVLPGKALPLRMHYHRTEHFIVLSGTAEVKRDENTMMIHENESVFIPQTTKYELANPGRIPLEIIEIRNGTYLGEDDIVEF